MVWPTAFREQDAGTRQALSFQTRGKRDVVCLVFI